MQLLGELAALGAAFCWSFSSYIFTEAARKISAYQLNLSRLIIAWFFHIIVILIFRIEYNINTIQFIYLALSGFLGLTMGDWFLFKSFKEIGPRVSMLIMALNPAIAAIIAFFIMNEKLSIIGILGIFITLAGITLVLLEKKEEHELKFKITKIGVLYGILAAIGQGTGLIFSKLAFLQGDINSLVATSVRLFTGFIFLIPIGFLTGRLYNPFKLFTEKPKVLGLVVLASLLGPFLGINASFIGVIYTKVGIAATLMSTSPILMLPLSHIFYKEKLSWRAIFGAIIAVFGVSILFLH